MPTALSTSDVGLTAAQVFATGKAAEEIAQNYLRGTLGVVAASATSSGMWTGAPTYRVVVKNTKIQNIVKVALEGTLDGVQKPDILSFSYQAKIGDDAASIAEGLTASINQSPASAVFGVRANRRDNAVELLIPANLVQLTKAKWHPSPTDVAQEVTISETQVK